MLLINLFGIAVLGGAYGGFLNALNKKSGIQLPQIQKSATLGKVFKPGLLRNVLMGIGASIVFVGLVTFIPYSFTTLQILALSIAAGYSGSKLLTNTSDKVAEQAKDLLDFLSNKKK